MALFQASEFDKLVNNIRVNSLIPDISVLHQSAATKKFIETNTKLPNLERALDKLVRVANVFARYLNSEDVISNPKTTIERNWGTTEKQAFAWKVYLTDLAVRVGFISDVSNGASTSIDKLVEQVNRTSDAISSSEYITTALTTLSAQIKALDDSIADKNRAIKVLGEQTRKARNSSDTYKTNTQAAEAELEQVKSHLLELLRWMKSRTREIVSESLSGLLDRNDALPSTAISSIIALLSPILEAMKNETGVADIVERLRKRERDIALISNPTSRASSSTSDDTNYARTSGFSPGVLDIARETHQNAFTAQQEELRQLKSEQSQDEYLLTTVIEFPRSLGKIMRVEDISVLFRDLCSAYNTQREIHAVLTESIQNYASLLAEYSDETAVIALSIETITQLVTSLNDSKSKLENALNAAPSLDTIQQLSDSLQQILDNQTEAARKDRLYDQTIAGTQTHLQEIDKQLSRFTTEKAQYDTEIAASQARRETYKEELKRLRIKQTTATRSWNAARSVVATLETQVILAQQAQASDKQRLAEVSASQPLVKKRTNALNSDINKITAELNVLRKKNDELQERIDDLDETNSRLTTNNEERSTTEKVHRAQLKTVLDQTESQAADIKNKETDLKIITQKAKFLNKIFKNVQNSDTLASIDKDMASARAQIVNQLTKEPEERYSVYARWLKDTRIALNELIKRNTRYEDLKERIVQLTNEVGAFQERLDEINAQEHALTINTAAQERDKIRVEFEQEKLEAARQQQEDKAAEERNKRLQTLSEDRAKAEKSFQARAKELEDTIDDQRKARTMTEVALNMLKRKLADLRTSYGTILQEAKKMDKDLESRTNQVNHLSNELSKKTAKIDELNARGRNLQSSYNHIHQLYNSTVLNNEQELIRRDIAREELLAEATQLRLANEQLDSQIKRLSRLTLPNETTPFILSPIYDGVVKDLEGRLARALTAEQIAKDNAQRLREQQNTTAADLTREKERNSDARKQFKEDLKAAEERYKRNAVILTDTRLELALSSLETHRAQLKSRTLEAEEQRATIARLAALANERQTMITQLSQDLKDTATARADAERLQSELTQLQRTLLLQEQEAKASSQSYETARANNEALLMQIASVEAQLAEKTNKLSKVSEDARRNTIDSFTLEMDLMKEHNATLINQQEADEAARNNLKLEYDARIKQFNDDFDAQLAEYARSANADQAAITALELARDEYRDKSDRLEAANSVITSTQKRTQDTLNELEVELAARERELAEQSQQVTAIRIQLDTASKLVTGEIARGDEARARISVLESDLALSKARLSDSERKYNELNTSRVVEDLREELAAMQQQTKEAQTKREAMQRRLVTQLRDQAALEEQLKAEKTARKQEAENNTRRSAIRRKEIESLTQQIKNGDTERENLNTQLQEQKQIAERAVTFRHQIATELGRVRKEYKLFRKTTVADYAKQIADLQAHIQAQETTLTEEKERLDLLESENAAAAQKIKDFRVAQQVAKEKLTAAQDELARVQRESQDSIANLQKSSADDLATTRIQLTEEQAQVEILRLQQTESQENYARLQQEYQSSIEIHLHTQQELEATNSKLSEARITHQATEERLQQLTATYQASITDLENVTRQLSTTNTTIIELNATMNTRDSEINRLTQQITDAAEQRAILEETIADVTQERLNLQNNSRQLEVQAKEAEKHQAELIDSLQKITTDRDQALVDLQTSISEAQITKASIAALQKETDRLKSELVEQENKRNAALADAAAMVEVLDTNMHDDAEKIESVEEREERELEERDKQIEDLKRRLGGLEDELRQKRKSESLYQEDIDDEDYITRREQKKKQQREDAIANNRDGYDYDANALAIGVPIEQFDINLEHENQYSEIVRSLSITDPRRVFSRVEDYIIQSGVIGREAFVIFDAFYQFAKDVSGGTGHTSGDGFWTSTEKGKKALIADVVDAATIDTGAVSAMDVQDFPNLKPLLINTLTKIIDAYFLTRRPSPVPSRLVIPDADTPGLQHVQDVHNGVRPLLSSEPSTIERVPIFSDRGYAQQTYDFASVIQNLVLPSLGNQQHDVTFQVSSPTDTDPWTTIKKDTPKTLAINALAANMLKYLHVAPSGGRVIRRPTTLSVRKLLDDVRIQQQLTEVRFSGERYLDPNQRISGVLSSSVDPVFYAAFKRSLAQAKVPLDFSSSLFFGALNNQRFVQLTCQNYLYTKAISNEKQDAKARAFIAGQISNTLEEFLRPENQIASIPIPATTDVFARSSTEGDTASFIGFNAKRLREEQSQRALPYIAAKIGSMPDRSVRRRTPRIFY